MTSQPLADLAPEDRLMLVVGRTAQKSVEVEHLMRVIWVDLVGGNADTTTAPTGNRDVVKGIERLADQSIELTEEERTTLRRAVRSASHAQQRRNTVVHERWALDKTTASWIPTTGNSRQMPNDTPKPNWTEAEFESVLIDLHKASLQLAVLAGVVATARGRAPQTMSMTADESIDFRAKLLAIACSLDAEFNLPAIEDVRRMLTGNRPK